MGIKKDFTDFTISVFRGWGLDTLSAKLISCLYIEPEEMALDELAKITGYSLPSISNKMRLIEGIGFVKRIKKPKSKKVYYSMTKSLVELSEMKFKKAFDTEIIPAKQKIPEIINKYKNTKLSEEERKQLVIIKNYYKDVLMFEKLMKKIQLYLEKMKNGK